MTSFLCIFIDIFGLHWRASPRQIFGEPLRRPVGCRAFFLARDRRRQLSISQADLIRVKDNPVVLKSEGQTELVGSQVGFDLVKQSAFFVLGITLRYDFLSTESCGRESKHEGLGRPSKPPNQAAVHRTASPNA